MIHKMFIIQSFDSYGGYFGKGTTREAAEKQWKKSGGRMRGPKAAKIIVLNEFTADIPFVPIADGKREGDGTTEADCWCDRNGGTNWKGCERKETTILDKTKKAKQTA